MFVLNSDISYHAILFSIGANPMNYSVFMVKPAYVTCDFFVITCDDRRFLLDLESICLVE
jgi:hypothetical protein